MNLDRLFEIFIPVAVVLLVILLVFAIFLYRKRKRINELATLGEQADFKRIRQIDVTLNRVHYVAQENTRYRETSLQLNTIYDELTIAINRAKRLFKNLEETTKSKKFWFKKYDAIKVEFKDVLKTIETLDAKFKSVAAYVTHQDEYMRNEFAYYQKCLRKVSEVYGDKRILLDNIAPQIDKLKEAIRQVEKKFEHVVRKADNEEADKLLRRYASLVLRFANVINEGPAIGVHISKQIPRAAEAIKTMYVKKKEEIAAPFEHIDFRSAVRKSSKRFDAAAKFYTELDMESSKNEIKAVLKSFKQIEKMINFEIKSRNVFIKRYEDTIREIKRGLEEYLSLKKQVKTLIGKGQQLNPDLIEQYEHVKALSKEVDTEGLKIRETMLDKTIPYSAKFSRLKVVLTNLNQFIEQMNVLVDMLWSINIEESLLRDKFKRSEAAINEIIAHLKAENIILSPEEENEFNRLIAEKTIISKQFASETNKKELSERVNNFSIKATDFYKAINGNIQIAMHIKNMFKELAPRRVVDEKLNINLIMAERDFLEGRYAASLSIIINSIKKGAL